MKEFLSSRFRSQWVYRTKYGTAYSPNLITLRKVPNQLNKNYLVNKSTYSGLSAAGTTINEPWVRHCSAAATGCVLAMMQPSRILISSLLLMSYVSIHLFVSVLRSARRNDRPPDGTISSCLFYLVQNLLWYSRQKRTALLERWSSLSSWVTACTGFSKKHYLPIWYLEQPNPICRL